MNEVIWFVIGFTITLTIICVADVITKHEKVRK